MKFVAMLLTLTVAAAVHAKPYMALDAKSWGDLKNICENYADFGAQIPPEDIQVKCQTTRKYTEVIGSDEVSFKSTGYLTMSLTSTKANVSPVTSSISMAPVTVLCPKVAQFQQVASGTFATTCEEMKKYEGTYVDYCSEKLGGGSFEGQPEQIKGTERSLCAKNSCNEEPLN